MRGNHPSRVYKRTVVIKTAALPLSFWGRTSCPQALILSGSDGLLPRSRESYLFFCGVVAATRTTCLLTLQVCCIAGRVHILFPSILVWVRFSPCRNQPQGQSHTTLMARPLTSSHPFGRKQTFLCLFH